MICGHVLGLIDAGPFADYPRAHLEAAWQHADQCQTCGPALHAARAMTRDLSARPQLTPSRDLANSVLARVAAIDAAAHMDATAEPTRPAVVRDVWGWATAGSALAATVAIAALIASGELRMGDMIALRGGGLWVPWVDVPSMTKGLLTLATVLGLYAVGLFAPGGVRPRKAV